MKSLPTANCQLQTIIYNYLTINHPNPRPGCCNTKQDAATNIGECQCVFSGLEQFNIFGREAGKCGESTADAGGEKEFPVVHKNFIAHAQCQNNSNDKAAGDIYREGRPGKEPGRDQQGTGITKHGSNATPEAH